MSDIAALARSLSRRLGMAISRAVVRRANDATATQTLQLGLLQGEVKDGVERFQEYGFTSVPVAGAEALALFIGGHRDHGVVVALDDKRHRLAGLKAGEVAIYTLEDDGAARMRIRLGQGRRLEILGGDILIRGDRVVRIEGDGVEIHGATYVQTDVHGKGSRTTHAGGVNYDVDSHEQGAVVSSTEHGLDQPDIPSDHPGES